MEDLDEPRDDIFAPLSFSNWYINLFALPVIVAVAWLLKLTPFNFLMRGFHIWVHEFGHATAAWMTGRKATPLPIGWTPIQDEYSHFVYFGVLLLMGILFVAGWKERKIWPMLIALCVAALQFQLTWNTPLYRQEFWWTFCGIGGEFYLSALFIIAFYVQFPEKFRWGFCRWIFLFIGVSSLLNIYLFWGRVYDGLEDIPMGSLVNGEDDANGDMNILMTEYGWSHSMIRRTFYNLGNACLIGIAMVYSVFALRVNLFADQIIAKLITPKEE